MIQLQSNWLAAVPWEKVEAIHQELCQGRQLSTTTNPKTHPQARSLWEDCCRSPHSLQEALEMCRRCLAAKPFVFLNADTMAAAARNMLESGLDLFPSVEAQVIRTTVSHYVAGQIPRRELEQVLKHFEPAWTQATSAKRPPPEEAMPAVHLSTRELPRPMVGSGLA